MAEYKIDSWNTEQLARLRDFFARKAKPGDTVIFDLTLAEQNVPAREGLDDDGCNSFVYRAANMALDGLDEERMRLLSEKVTLTTRSFAGSAAPSGQEQDFRPEPEPETELDEEEDLEEDLDFALGLEEPALAEEPAPDDEDDPAAAEWARTLKKYYNEHEPC